MTSLVISLAACYKVIRSCGAQLKVRTPELAVVLVVTWKASFFFIGTFVKLRKATASFVRSVCPSVRTEQLGSHWANYLNEILYLSIFRKSVEKIQALLKSDKNSGYFT